jgi:hypothetical protein
VVNKLERLSPTCHSLPKWAVSWCPSLTAGSCHYPENYKLYTLENLSVVGSRPCPLERLVRENTLAYSDPSPMTKKKVVMILTPGINVITLFSFIADDEAK